MRSEAILNKRYVQYGCGLSAPEGWISFDASPRLRLERLPGVGLVADTLNLRLFPCNVAYGDIVAGLPVPDGSVDAIYASHVLEHLAREDVSRAIANTYKALRPGGVFRMIVPDLASRAERYLRDRCEGRGEAADAFIGACHIGLLQRRRGLVGTLRSFFGYSGHRWMYDRELMSNLLREAGFVEIRPCEFHDSNDPMFDLVEDRRRFVDDGHTEVALQARRPDEPRATIRMSA